MTQGDEETMDGRSGFFGARPSGMHADAPAAATQPPLDDPLLAVIGYECAHPELQRGWPGAAPERG
jgi:hypothetical protein